MPKVRTPKGVLFFLLRRIKMSFRVVLIENEVDVKVQLDNLILNTYEGEVCISIDDISIIVLDNLRIRLTTRMMSILANNNVGVIICDTKHMPIGFYSSYDNHSRVSKKIGFQIKQESSFYDEFWCEIIDAKIKNQSQVLEKLNFSKEKIDKIKELKMEIEVGDITNREAHAAKIYFNEMMGTSFSRGNEDLLINSGLDYGYAIIRSYIARVLVGYGLNSQLGIHHRSEYNRFNLVDDLIEPWRPIVDFYVFEILNDDDYFRVEHRRMLVNMLNHKIVYSDKKMFLCNAIEEYVSQYSSLLEGRRKDIEFPTVEGYLGENSEL